MQSTRITLSLPLPPNNPSPHAPVPPLPMPPIPVLPIPPPSMPPTPVQHLADCQIQERTTHPFSMPPNIPLPLPPTPGQSFGGGECPPPPPPLGRLQTLESSSPTPVQHLVNCEVQEDHDSAQSWQEPGAAHVAGRFYRIHRFNHILYVILKICMHTMTTPRAGRNLGLHMLKGSGGLRCEC